MHAWVAPEVRGDINALKARAADAQAMRMARCAVLSAAVFLLLIISCTSLWSSASPRRLEAWTGSPHPAFSLPDLDGTTHAVAALRGRVVLVHFFATWCEPCREELASLTRLVERRSGETLSVLAVNVAEVPVRVRRFLEAAPTKFPVVLDANRAVTKAWGVSGLPTTFVLDQTLVARLFVEGDLDWTRDDILAALAQPGAGKQ